MPSSPRSVLLIAFHFPPEALPGAVRPSRFFQYLPEFGFEPEVITSAVQTEANPRIQTVPATTYIPNKYTIAGAIEILLHKIFWPGELGLLWAGPASTAAHRLMKERPVSAVISTCPPINTHLAALVLKMRYGIPWIADFRDPMFDNPHTPTLRRTHLAMHRKLERMIFRHADAIIAVSDVPAEWWRKRFPEYAHKIHVLWNGYNPSENLTGLPVPPRPYRVLSHVGNLYGKRRPEVIINALVRLFERNSLNRENIRLQFVGEIGHDVWEADGAVLSQLQKDGVMECTGLVPRPQALQLTAESDYLMMLDIQDGEGYTVPSKLFEYVRIGRPMLTVTQPNSPVERILGRCGVPNIIVYPRDPEETVCQKLQQLFELPSDTTKPSDWFLDTFDGRRQTGTLASMLESIQKSKG
jgi:glycosyltransferase involved in cell wall biosynthesis